jgi:putative ATP-binding cassette transporter
MPGQSRDARPLSPPSPRALWALARPYWFSEERWQGRGLLAAILLANLLLVYLQVRINQWNNAFFNALQDRDFAEFTVQL